MIPRNSSGQELVKQTKSIEKKGYRRKSIDRGNPENDWKKVKIARYSFWVKIQVKDQLAERQTSRFPKAWVQILFNSSSVDGRIR